MSDVDALTAGAIEAGAQAVRDAAVNEAQRQAVLLVGAGPLPGTTEWAAEDGTDAATRRQRAWQLVSLRLQVAVGLDGLPEVVLLRRSGATWAEIGRAVGMTRQSAHERWGGPVLAVLDRYGSGELGGPVADDDPRMLTS